MSELTATTNTEQVNQELSPHYIDPVQAYERGKVDINFFATLLLPTVMLSAFPPFYVAIFKMLVNRTPKQMGRILRFALGLPRAHAKTTFIKVIIAWLIAYDKIRFAAILCATDPLAEELIEDVSEMLGSVNAERIYGRWTDQLSTDSKGLKKALYHDRNVIIAAKGAGGAIRGVNIKHERPDLIFCDDAQTKECDDSPTESAKFRKRLVSTFKIIAPRGDRLIIYVGNMYSDTCILWQLKENKSWISFVTGAILADGMPLWPELHSLDELLDSFIHDTDMNEADVWFAEVMNDPVSRAMSLLYKDLPDAPHLFNVEIPDGVFITIDPAGFKSASDDNVIVLHYVYDGKPTVMEISAGIKDPEQLILEALRIAMRTGASVIGVEDVAYQSTLLFWFNKYLLAWKITGITIVPLKTRNRSKEDRIRLFCEDAMAGNYYIHPGCKATWIWQALKYKIGKKDNKDDILDGVAYGLDMRSEYWPLISNNKRLGLSRSAESTAIVLDNTPF